MVQYVRRMDFAVNDLRYIVNENTIMLFVRTCIALRRPQPERHVHVLQSAQQTQMHMIIDITLVDFLLVHIFFVL